MSALGASWVWVHHTWSSFELSLTPSSDERFLLSALPPHWTLDLHRHCHPQSSAPRTFCSSPVWRSARSALQFDRIPAPDAPGLWPAPLQEFWMPVVQWYRRKYSAEVQSVKNSWPRRQVLRPSPRQYCWPRKWQSKLYAPKQGRSKWASRQWPVLLLFRGSNKANQIMSILAQIQDRYHKSWWYFPNHCRLCWVSNGHNQRASNSVDKYLSSEILSQYQLSQRQVSC